MRNYIEPGDSLTVTAPAPVASGGVVAIGFLIGIATVAASAGSAVVVKTEGVFELPKVSTQAYAAGDPLYWDATAGNLTSVAATNPRIGYASEPSSNPSSVGRVRLTPRAS